MIGTNQQKQPQSGQIYRFRTEHVEVACDASAASSKEYDYEHEMAVRQAQAADLTYDTDDEILNPYDRTRRLNDTNRIERKREEASRVCTVLTCGMAMVAIGMVIYVAGDLNEHMDTRENMRQHVSSQALSSGHGESSTDYYEIQGKVSGHEVTVGEESPNLEQEEPFPKALEHEDEEDLRDVSMEATLAPRIPILVQPFAVDEFVEPPLSNIGVDAFFDTSVDTPFFWSIPHVKGGSSLEQIMSECLDLTIAGSSHGYLKDDHLALIVDGHQHYVNVDVATEDGAKRAFDLDLVPTKLADVVVSPAIFPTVQIFDGETTRGSMFALIQDPMERILTEYNESLKGHESLGEFIKDETTDNYMVRALTNQLGFLNHEMTQDDLDNAKDLLESKSLVGLTQFYASSVHRMVQFFQWMERLNGNNKLNNYDCQEKHINDVEALSTDDLVPAPFESMDDFRSSAEFELIVEKNALDMELYIFAQSLYFRQRELPAFAN